MLKVWALVRMFLFEDQPTMRSATAQTHGLETLLGSLKGSLTAARQMAGAGKLDLAIQNSDAQNPFFESTTFVSMKHFGR
jgi:hypothetical protein